MSQLQTQANRSFGLLTGRPTGSNINGVDSGLTSTTPSSGSSILDTLKKKMNQLKEELEISRDESTRYQHSFEEEKRRREIVKLLLLEFKSKINF